MAEQQNEKKSSPEAGAAGEIERGRAWLTGVGLGALMLAALVIAFIIGTNYSDEPLPEAPSGNQASEAPAPVLSEQGRTLFVSTCGGCHALAEAKTTGTAGPNLDDLAPDEALVEQAIAQGGTGSGVMPPGLLTGGDAKEVAAYVAAAAGGD